MPGPAEIMGRWVGLKVRDLISDWRKNRKTSKQEKPEDKFFANGSNESPYYHER